MSAKDDTSCEPLGNKKKLRYRLILRFAFSVAKGLYFVYKVGRKIYEILTDL